MMLHEHKRRAEDDSNDKKGWKVDKHIPVAVILTMFIQTCAVVWWAATIDGRVNNVERWQQQADGTQLSPRTTRLEVKMESIVDSLHRVELKLDKIVERGR